MKTKRFIWVGMCALLFLVLPSRSEFIRKWTSQDGSTIQARFADMSGSDVILQTADGGYVKMDYSSLSQADQTYLRKLRRRQENQAIINAQQQPANVLQQDNPAGVEEEKAEQERQAKLREQDRLRTEKEEELSSKKEDLRLRASKLKDDIRYEGQDYEGLSSQAKQLSVDAASLGEDGASRQFNHAAEKLREANWEKNDTRQKSSTFGSSEEDHRKEEAGRDVERGGDSISSFNTSTSMEPDR